MENRSKAIAVLFFLVVLIIGSAAQQVLKKQDELERQKKLVEMQEKLDGWFRGIEGRTLEYMVRNPSEANGSSMMVNSTVGLDPGNKMFVENLSGTDNSGSKVELENEIGAVGLVHSVFLLMKEDERLILEDSFADTELGCYKLRGFSKIDYRALICFSNGNELAYFRLKSLSDDFEIVFYY